MGGAYGAPCSGELQFWSVMQSQMREQSKQLGRIADALGGEHACAERSMADGVDCAGLHKAVQDIIDTINAWHNNGSMENWQHSQLLGLLNPVLAAIPEGGCGVNAGASGGARRNAERDTASGPLTLDEAIAHADEAAGDCGTACKREHKQLADWLRELKAMRNAEQGNCAKLREALETLLNLAYEVQDANNEHGPKTSVPAQFIIDTAKSALASPPRQCDIGTDNEQIGRWKEFCDRYEVDRSPESFARWAQGPHLEEGGAK